jgi:hypothetical protein
MGRISSLIILISFATVLQLRGQDYVDLFKAYYANTPLNAFDSADAQTRVEEMGFSSVLPIQLDSTKYLLTGVNFERLSTRTAPEKTDITSVYTVLMKFGLSVNHNARWTGTYMFLPKLSSDLREVGRKDFQYGGLVYFKYHKSHRLKYQFGLYFNSELFGPFFVALAGIYYQSADARFEANLNLPLLADLNYKFGNWFRVGMEFDAFVNSYHINQPQYTVNNEYLVKRSNELFLYTHFDVSKSIILRTRVGYTIGRQYALYDAEDQVTFGFSAFRFGDDREQLNQDFADGMIFKIDLIYRYSR